MEENDGGKEDIRFPYSGQLEVEIYFREYKDSCANDCRRFLHKGRDGGTPIIKELQDKLNENKSDLIIIPKDYALLRYVPENIDADRDLRSKRNGSGIARGGLEIYDVPFLEKSVFDKLREVLDEKRKKELPWFSFYRIYLREELK
jgi:hypothetical protein